MRTPPDAATQACDVVVVGQGYVGAPLAVTAALAGHTVTGVDIDPGRVAALNAAAVPAHGGDVDPRMLRLALRSRRYRCSTSLACCAGADVILVCVPTPFDEAPDLRHVTAAVDGVCGHLRAGTLVVLESTTYPGSTEEVVARRIAARCGLDPWKDLDVAYSPERIDPGNPSFGVANTPRVVGGLTDRATRRAARFYRTFVHEVVPVSGAREAEMAKLLENTFRQVNIALANEIAQMCRELGVDVWEVIDAAATKPFGFMRFTPGPGVGGHCIPVDPMYLSWKVREVGGQARLIELAREINEAMPAHCVARVGALLAHRAGGLARSRILLLGVSYKAGVDDLRGAPAWEVFRLLHEHGATVAYHDPHVEEGPFGRDGAVLRSVPLDRQALEWADCVVVLTAHRGVDYDLVAECARVVFDTRGCLPLAPSVHRL